MRFAIPLSALLAACTGGGGSLPGDGLVTQDRAATTNESGGNTTERASATNESVARTGESTGSSESAPSSSGGGSGTFNCLGTFACVVTIEGVGSVTQTVSLGGTCQTEGAGLNPDGTVTSEGKVVGTWHPTSGGGFAYSGTQTENGKSFTYTANCTKISDAPSTTTGPSVTTVTLDAGVR